MILLRARYKYSHLRLITREIILLNGDVLRRNGNVTCSVNRPLILSDTVAETSDAAFFLLLCCDVYLRVNEQRNILHEISKRKANWVGHILRRNCLLQWVIEGKIKGGIEVIGRRGRRRRKLLDDLKERRGYCQLKEEARDRTMWRAGFGNRSDRKTRKKT